MIHRRTMLKVADNSGARIAQCLNILGGSRRRYGQIGDIIVVSIKKAEPRKEVKVHDKQKAVIIRQKKAFRRDDGFYIRFDENACCILGEGKNPKANRVFGPIPRELKDKDFKRIATLAEELV